MVLGFSQEAIFLDILVTVGEWQINKHGSTSERY